MCGDGTAWQPQLFGKEMLTQQHMQCSAFVWKIEFLEIGVAAMGEISHHLVIIDARLDDYALRPAIIQEQIMRDRRQPGRHERLAAHLRLAN